MGSKKSLYVSDDIESIINLGEHSPESFSGRVSFLVQAASLMAAEQCPALPVAVWRALCDANNNVLHFCEHGAPAAVSVMALNLFDANCQIDINPHECHEWGKKIRKMSFAQQFAIFETIRRFWSQPDAGNRRGDYAEAFRKLGAKIAE